MNKEKLREDGVSNLGYGEEEEKEQEDELPHDYREEAVSELPRKEKDGKKCIDPCPKFECELSPDTCENNCGRCLENPCLICTHDCTSLEKDVLLREEYKNYRKYYGGKKTDAITKDKVAERRVKLFDEKEELENKVKNLKESSRESILPTKLSWLLSRKQYKNIKSRLKEIKYRIKEGEELFKFR